MASSPVVVKVSGSLFNLPNLGPRLRQWLEELNEPKVLLLPGGGAAADVIRAFDRLHHLGEETCHWLALRALGLNAHFLEALLKVKAKKKRGKKGWVVVDGHDFARADEGRRGALPHCWDATSDSLAARVAVVAGARRLILLKSVALPKGMSWREAGRRGIVDACFARAVKKVPEVDVVNFRAWRRKKTK